MINQFRNSWKEYFANRKNIFDLIITIVALIILLSIFTKFLIFVENRNGFSFEDPILKLFKPIDLSYLTFGIMYFSIILALSNFLFNPKELVFALKCYSIMLLIRMAAMYLLPLNPPLDMIPLIDPLVSGVGTGKLMTKDLFFSGHTATMFIMFLCTKKKWIKSILLISTILIAKLVLLQHVHYSIDVMAAPIFAYAAYRISKYMF